MKKHKQKAGWRMHLRYNYLGLVSAAIAFCFSVLPSLLPRPWLFQGIISGVSIAVGYGIGVLVSFLIRWFVQAELPKAFRQAMWRALVVVAPPIIIAYAALGSRWQSQVRELIGRPPQGGHFIRVLALALLVGWILVQVARLTRKLTKKCIDLLDIYLPRRISVGLGFLFILVAFYWVVSGVFYSFFVTQANNIYRKKNDSIPAGVTQPTSSNRSGSPVSLVGWDTVGYQGRAFVGKGPSTTDLARFTPAVKEPVRVYVGLKTADTPAKRADLAVAELKRTHAFDRKVLILATPTGTGWMEPHAVDSLEYLYGGDSAIVAQQYSYLPSWISFLVDQNNATDAGQALFDAVWSEWSKLPEDHRPKLITWGLSLGSFGSQSAFSGVNDTRLSVDGALWVGTPNSTQLWRNITNRRDPGSPEWQPVYQNGKAVQFASSNSTVSTSDTWHTPRMLYLQHASDPVVWFSFDLMTNKPDWLNERRGPDVSSSVRWYPFVTFLQVGVDQFFGTTVPQGHGHNYGDMMVQAWQAVAEPEGWTPEKTQQLKDLIASY